MTRIHDMGGRFGDGPVPREADESKVFSTDWHARALALTVAAGALGKWNIDASRHGRERLPPADYAQYSYYEKWIAGLAKMLVEHGIASPAEIAAGRSLADAPDELTARCLAGDRVVPVMKSGGPSARDSDTAASFAMEMRVAVGKDMRPVMQHDCAGAPGHIGGKAGMAAIHSLVSGNGPHPHPRTDGE